MAPSARWRPGHLPGREGQEEGPLHTRDARPKAGAEAGGGQTVCPWGPGNALQSACSGHQHAPRACETPTSCDALAAPESVAPRQLPRDADSEDPAVGCGSAAPAEPQNRGACGPKPDVDWGHLLDLRRKGGG